MEEVIERILKAESDAKEKVAQAKERGREIVLEARARRSELVDELREQARKQAHDLVQQARAQADLEKERIVEESKRDAQVIIDGAEVKDYSILTEFINKIAGLE